MKAVRPYTIKGHLLYAVIKGMAIIVHVFKRKKWIAAREFEENPRTMKAQDLLYFAYKYYYKPPHLPSHSDILSHFKSEKPPIPEFETLLTISLGGDLMPYEMIKPENTTKLWDKIGTDFFGSDIVFANLETPVDLQKKPSFVPEVMLSHMLFNTDETTFNIFNGNGQYKGFDVLSISNNHSLDMGVQGLKNTINYLEDQNIKSVGAAKDKTSFEQTIIIEKKGFKIGFISYTFSLNQFAPPMDEPWLVNCIPLNLPESDISLIQKQAEHCKKAGAEVLICSLHTGNAYQIYPGKTAVDLFEKIFKTCGVDVIVGGHPHNLQPWRNYIFTDPTTGKQKNGFAIYSLGDFIAYDIFTWCHLCAYIKLEIGRHENGEIAIRPLVNPLIMERKNQQLQLQYANEVFKKPLLSEEEKDLKILYDLCIN